MALSVGKALIVDSRSGLVAYLEVPLLSDVFRILKGLAFNNDYRCQCLPVSQYSR